MDFLLKIHNILLWRFSLKIFSPAPRRFRYPKRSPANILYITFNIMWPQQFGYRFKTYVHFKLTYGYLKRRSANEKIFSENLHNRILLIFKRKSTSFKLFVSKSIKILIITSLEDILLSWQHSQTDVMQPSNTSFLFCTM